MGRYVADFLFNPAPRAVNKVFLLHTGGIKYYFIEHIFDRVVFLSEVLN